MAIIDIQKIAASMYSNVQKLNQTASNLYGVDAAWSRLLPYDNGADVIIQEYTLHGYECAKNVRVLISNTNYNVGNFSIDLFGIKSSEQLEIGIDATEWKKVYGENTMPQKGDFVLIPMMHKPYEVMSSSPVHTIGELLTSWKCTLGEWKHAASRQESEEFRISIDELTVSQDRLFGKQISQEVADAVVEAETAYNTTTYVDPYKEYDMKSIIVKDLECANGNIFTHAYYNFNNADKNITYKTQAIYDPAVDENHWIYSCWFRKDDDTNTSGKLKINSLKLKEKDYWYFDIQSGISVNNGDIVNIYRGNMINLIGIIETNECGPGYTVKITSADCFKASKKAANWWQSGIWKIEKAKIYNFISMYDGVNNNFRIDMNGNDIIICINGYKQTVNIGNNAKINFSDWNYIAFDITDKNISTVIVRNKPTSTGGYENILVNDSVLSVNITGIMNFDNICIENAGVPFNMCNIRLYENEYPLEDGYKIDMASPVTRNASKLILVDNPNPANNMSFVSPIK